eukprot:1161419-Pelagomonas_calceolata.AAC.7
MTEASSAGPGIVVKDTGQQAITLLLAPTTGIKNIFFICDKSLDARPAQKPLYPMLHPTSLRRGQLIILFFIFASWVSDGSNLRTVQAIAAPLMGGALGNCFVNATACQRVKTGASARRHLHGLLLQRHGCRRCKNAAVGVGAT